MKFVLASHNKGKLAEMQRILGQLGVEVVLQSDLGLALEPEENGTTFAENAMIKAKAVMQASGLPAIADDSGLCVDALGGAPGIYSRALRRARRRQGALSAPAAESARGDDARGALPHVGRMLLPGRRCADGRRASVRGTIAYAPQGEGGFGYDPVFFVPQLRKTFAQLTPEEKNAISHRGNALRAFAEKLKEYMEKNGWN